MNVFITGISGFVGQHLTGHILREADHEILGLLREQTDAAGLSPRPRVVLREGDVTHVDSLVAVLREFRPDVVFHLAAVAFSPAASQSALDAFQTNIVGTAALLEAVRTTAPNARILHVSSGVVYGDADRPHTEDSPLRPVDPYASSKAAADLIAQTYRRTFGLDVIIARPFNQTGPGQPSQYVCSSIAKQLSDLRRSGAKPLLRLGNIHVARDFSDVRDVVRALWTLASGPRRHDIYNICSGVPTPIKTIIDLLSEISGLSPDLITDAGRVRSRDVNMLAGSAERLQNETGWKPQFDLRTTLSDLYQYYQNKKD